jgi:hypothetical protein
MIHESWSCRRPNSNRAISPVRMRRCSLLTSPYWLLSWPPSCSTWESAIRAHAPITSLSCQLPWPPSCSTWVSAIRVHAPMTSLSRQLPWPPSCPTWVSAGREGASADDVTPMSIAMAAILFHVGKPN